MDLPEDSDPKRRRRYPDNVEYKIDVGRRSGFVSRYRTNLTIALVVLWAAALTAYLYRKDQTDLGAPPADRANVNKRMEQIEAEQKSIRVEIDKLTKTVGMLLDRPRMAGEASPKQNPSPVPEPSSKRALSLGGASGSQTAEDVKRSEKIHVVRSGETLSSIAKLEYGDASQWRRIRDANKNLSSNSVLRSGQQLRIPNIQPE